MSSWQRVLFFCSLVIALPCAGCMHPRTTKLRLVSTLHTNGGKPLAVLVRTSDSRSFRKDSYADVERLFVNPDRSVLRSVTIFPAQRGARCIDFPYQNRGGFAVYALYERAEGVWKVLYEPTTPHRLELSLGTHQIDIANSREKRPFLSSRDALLSLPSEPPKELGIPPKQGELPSPTGKTDGGGSSSVVPPFSSGSMPSLVPGRGQNP